MSTITTPVPTTHPHTHPQESSAEPRRLSLSDNAAEAVKKIIRDQALPETTRLRVGVKGGGCSGFSYMLDLVDEAPSDMDEQLEEKGVKMLVDMKSLLYLEGTEIDYRDEVMATGFVFKNPRAVSTCGCGSSFSA